MSVAKKQRPEPLTLQQQLELAAAALTDPRTIARFLRGERTRALTAEKIRLAMERLGWPMPAPAAESGPTKAA